MRKRKLVKEIERLMVKEELELQYLDDQHSRAYHSGVIDGLGNALFAISPTSAKRNPISIVWYEEDEQVSPSMLERIKERKRERSFEHQNTRLFATSEAD